MRECQMALSQVKKQGCYAFVERRSGSDYMFLCTGKRCFVRAVTWRGDRGVNTCTLWSRIILLGFDIGRRVR